MNKKKMITKKFKQRSSKIIAVYLALNILFECIAPSCAFALTGGPSQPEVQSFEPVGTSDMVDLFSGDFNYNIPLMDVDGYPINISYHSGVTMDQEASWVGLGWNLNPGVINRSMRGLPDDFNGDVVTKKFKMKENKTYGFNTGAGIELFGFERLRIGLNYSIGVKYNNYNGVSADQSLNVSIGAGDPSKSSLTGSLGLNSSSEDGLSLQPRVSFSAKAERNTKGEQNGLGVSVGCSFNSRAGLRALSFGITQSASEIKNKVEKSAGGNVVSSNFNLGQPTYTPQSGMPMNNLSITGSFKLGLEAIGLHPNFTVGGFYSCQKLATNTIENPAYGYMNADEGTKYDRALLDFNREKDGSFSPSTPALPLTNFTYDIFSVSGQGVGGSYRAFRSDMGHVFDASASNTSDGYSIGAEVGIGNVFHVGADITVNNVDGSSGRWKDGNPAAAKLVHRKSTGDPFYENYYFKEANEKSVDEDDLYDKMGKNNLQTIALKQNGKFNTIAEDRFVEGNRTIPSENYRKKRQRRSQPLTVLTRDEMAAYGLNELPSTSGIAKGSHIAEITTLKNDGTRYVYGYPVYNTSQEEVSFAVGKTLNATGGRTSDAQTGLVTYVPGDNSDQNELGLDNYFSSTLMPAYAHSYMLTAVLSPDYVDSDFNGANRGPSAADIGNYTKFNYDTKINNYKWRVPVGKNQATYNEGLKSDQTDDKANYLYGTKDLVYLSSIETKNYIAIFETKDRDDGFGVTDKDGARATYNSMKLLKTISLYLRDDYALNGNAAIPVKQVHFDYDYTLCPNVPNNKNYGSSSSSGKLTLRKISFSYQKSDKGMLSPYRFTYGTAQTNYAYNIKAYDRWGNYKPIEVNGVPTAEYPYVEQDSVTANLYSQAWSLTEVVLPSGGKIKVDYQSDDYAYVQDKQAGQMFKIIGVQTSGSTIIDTTSTPGSRKDLNNGSTNTRLIIKLQRKIKGSSQAAKDAIFRQQYLSGMDFLYFRCLMDIRDGKQEYVSGYLKMEDIDLNQCICTPSGDYGAIAIKPVKINDNSGIDVCPITKAAIQFGRLNMTRTVYSSTDIDNNMSEGFGKDLLVALMNSGFAKNIADAIAGPNYALYKAPYNVGKAAYTAKSWIRLNNPTKKKYGGGCRVSRIRMSDEWDGMGITENTGWSYGQEYLYTMPDGTSSGVASYEPQLGGDENPWKIPVFFSKEKLLAPDDEHYLEEPFGESFFPSASVGYKRVIVQNLQVAGVKHNATGKVIHEFYTAQDFPTIATRSEISKKQEKTVPLSIGALLNLKVLDYMTTTQSYVIELNDMHGKPKKQEVYQEGQKAPITSVEYYYQSDPYLVDKFKLNNTATVINSNGTVNTSAQLGVFSDFVSDMRQSTNETTSASFNINTDGFVIPPLPALIPIPIGMPSFSNEKTQFRSAVVTKVIQRFGILSRTVAKDLGSMVETKNIAYDAESGDVLLTETTTDFNDKVYNLTYPAYWYYNGMGPAYRNVGMNTTTISFSGGMALLPNALAYFAEGDEIALEGGIKAWVISVEPGIVKAQDVFGGGASGKFLKVLRSGRRNQQNVPMATITTRSNPLYAIANNTYNQVLQAQAMEYTNTWKTFCDCFATDGRGTSNPYVQGRKGMYKNKKSYAYLSGRSQSNYNNNTDIRKDGVLTSYSPFYRVNAGSWEMEPRDWTYTSEVTEFSPFGVELENKDPLNRYSAAQYGYNQTLPVAVAANSKYSNMAYDNFEDYLSATCEDNHFKFRSYKDNLTSSQAHSGKTSIKVTNGNAITITKQLAKCTPPYCNLSYADTTYTGPHTIKYTIKGGTPPYVFDWESLNGDLPVSIDALGTSIVVKQSLTVDYKLNLTVTDKNKCKQTFATINVPHY